MKCFSFNLFVAAWGTLVQSCPTIVVEVSRLHLGVLFSSEMETMKTKTGGTSRFCANVSSPDRIPYPHGGDRSFLYITTFDIVLAIWGDNIG